MRMSLILLWLISTFATDCAEIELCPSFAAIIIAKLPIEIRDQMCASTFRPNESNHGTTFFKSVSYIKLETLLTN